MKENRVRATADGASTGAAYRSRFRTELAAYGAAGRTGLLLDLAALVDFIEKNGILIGPGYGASPSSLLLYILGVTAIDPVADNLIFERVKLERRFVIPVEGARRGEVIGFLDRRRNVDGDESCGVEVIGMNELSVPALCERKVRDSAPLFRLNTIPRDDRATVELFRRGDTIEIELFASTGMRRLLQTAHPGSFSDLCVLDAVYRPPFIGNGLTAETARRIANGRAFPTDDPDSRAPEVEEAAEILAETYGILVYQEQVIAILTHLAGFSLTDAAAAVRVLSGGPEEKPDRLRASFLSAAVAYGLTRSRAERIFEFLSSRSPATYNKAHCLAFTTIAWQAAYCRTHYPEAFARARELSQVPA